MKKKYCKRTNFKGELNMCMCNECNKKDTENCIRIMESCSHQQSETMLHIELEALKHSYNNLLKGIEKMITLIGSESFWKIRDVERRN